MEFLAAELAVSARDLLAEQGIAAQDAVLTYIPRATAARLQYGTDQARELARALSRELSIPMLPLLERRPGMGRPQKHLNSAERLKNAKKTYRVRDYDGCRAKTVLLVDDIVTSGATVAICARLLRRAGASHVFALAVAADELQSERGG
ncbi:MAG: ComF family protein [Clostridia bacterium]|nr:ComF family protein [Clostridia bacterium]